uniref:Uncharacterized protein n=1 Tax=Homalodisca liturata TaxID=320908 RepID=A0A1B6ISM6_9HEMI
MNRAVLSPASADPASPSKPITIKTYKATAIAMKNAISLNTPTSMMIPLTKNISAIDIETGVPYLIIQSLVGSSGSPFPLYLFIDIMTLKRYITLIIIVNQEIIMQPARSVVQPKQHV